MQDNNVLLIINPEAGRKAAQKALYPIVRGLCKQEQMVTVFSTGRRGDATDIVQKHAAEYHRIICCGGDGTLNEVLTGLVKAGVNVPVGYVPTGTVNDMAHTLRLPQTLDGAIELAANGAAQRHDIGEFNGEKYFDYVASFGAFANVSYETPQHLKNLLGRAAYFLFGFPRAFGIRPVKAKVTADGKVIEGEFIYGGVSNSTEIAGVVKLPEKMVQLDDGRFEVLLVRGHKSFSLLHKVWNFLRHAKADSDTIYFFNASHVVFEFEQEVYFTLDGERSAPVKRAEIKNLSQAVRIVGQ